MSIGKNKPKMKYLLILTLFFSLLLSSCDLITNGSISEDSQPSTITSNSEISEPNSESESLEDISSSEILKSIKIILESDLVLEVNSSILLEIELTNLDGTVIWSTDSSNVSIDENGLVSAHSVGSGTITAAIENYTDTINYQVIPEKANSIIISANHSTIYVDEAILLSAIVNPTDRSEFVTYEILSGNSIATIDKNILTANKAGEVQVIGKVDGITSNTITLTIKDILATNISLTTEKYFITIGEIIALNSIVEPANFTAPLNYELLSGNDYISIKNNVVTGIKANGHATLVAKVGETVSNEIVITVVENGPTPTNITIRSSESTLLIGEIAKLSITTIPENAVKNMVYNITQGFDVISVVADEVTALKNGIAQIVATVNNVNSQPFTITVTDILTDPYENMSKAIFYSNYEPASSYYDSYYRTLHNFMSGELTVPDQEPTISQIQPKDGNLFIRNSTSYYNNDRNSYSIVDYQGNIVSTVYRGGAYITLEEVAAYIFAFGDVPSNYTEEKEGFPSTDPWGEYLRLNHSYFSGDTSRYPYEPELPNIRGIGGDLYYYELDIGTTGTDCDEAYKSLLYNDGKKITRGAARIVYTRYDAYNNEISDINDKFLFYTYNHYNDFQEYLNYYGGWGEMFGNITGGGTISSRIDYNPTPYINTALKAFTNN